MLKPLSLLLMKLEAFIPSHHTALTCMVRLNICLFTKLRVCKIKEPYYIAERLVKLSWPDSVLRGQNSVA